MAEALSGRIGIIFRDQSRRWDETRWDETRWDETMIVPAMRLAAPG